jgi:hypothetical protein
MEEVEEEEESALAAETIAGPADGLRHVHRRGAAVDRQKYIYWTDH